MQSNSSIGIRGLRVEDVTKRALERRGGLGTVNIIGVIAQRENRYLAMRLEGTP